MNLNTIVQVKRPKSFEEIDWRDGHAFLAGGTWLFSEPQVTTDTLVDLAQFGWPALTATPTGLEIAATCKIVELHDFKGPPEWFADNPREKAFGLGEVPIVYDPPLGGAKLEFVRQDKADGEDLARCWLQKEPARKLPNIAKVPMLIVVSEASYHAGYDHCTSAYLTQAGVKNTFLRLADRRVKGNGHMMMLEKNNQDIARVMAEWVERAVNGERRERVAGR